MKINKPKYNIARSIIKQKLPFGTISQTVRPIFLVIRSNGLLIRSINRSNGHPSRSNNYSCVQTVRQTVRTGYDPFDYRSLSVRFCSSNGFRLMSVLPFTVTFTLYITSYNIVSWGFIEACATCSPINT